MPPPLLHDAIKPLSWLLGKWKSVDAVVRYPTMKDFVYKEEIEFFHTGQPSLQFTFYAYNSATSDPMHRQIGFIRMQPGTNKLAFVSAHNIGLIDMEEGEVSGEQLTLETTNLAQMSFATFAAVKKLTRSFRKDGEYLEQIVCMETANAPLTEHLSIRFEKIE